ncbi:hypothetical protein OH492_05175 [Vibrio chagasii]|nr:hypothetical protein [Vibrio chagasii]
MVHTEIFFDPQTHTERAVSPSTLLSQALLEHSTKLHMNPDKQPTDRALSRHLMKTARSRHSNRLLPYKDKSLWLVLDSSEQGKST